MIPVCVSRCEDCTPVQCIVRPGCGDEHILGIGIGEADTDYEVYFTNLITDITRVFYITSGNVGDIVFDMVGSKPFLNGRLFRIVVKKPDVNEPEEIDFLYGTSFNCVEVEFKNLYDANGQPECPEVQWLQPY